MATDPTEQLVSSLSDDPEVRAAAKALALDAITSLRGVLRRGSPALQLQVASRMLPSIAKAIGEQKDGGDTALKDALEKLNRDVATALGVEDAEN